MNHDPFTVLTLLGTERMSAPPPPPHAVLADAWAALDWTARESAALGAMALAAAARAAGATSVSAEPIADPAPEETSPACAPAAAAVLRRMLGGGEHAELLGEWLALAARAGQRVAFRDLPALLERAARDAALRAAAGPVLGDRGGWLARRMPAWREVLETAAVADTAWETGTLPERVAWLRQTRATDPVRAATVLAQAWLQAAGDERERLLAIVAEAPTTHDIALLEGEALRDRRREVRLAARAALLRRPESAFAQRARALVASLVTVEGLLLGKRLVLRPPESFDPAWKADGIEEKPPAGTGSRAFWSRQWIASVPLSAWTERLGVTEEKLFALNRDDEWRETILLGWLDAALAAPEVDHAEALARHVCTAEPWPQGAPARGVVVARLLEVLDDAARARVLAAAPVGGVGEGLYFEVLFRSGFALPEAAAGTAVDRCVAAMQARPYPSLGAPHARELARRLPPSSLAGTLRRLAALPEPSSTTEEFLRALEFRQQLHLSFAADPS